MVIIHIHATMSENVQNRMTMTPVIILPIENQEIPFVHWCDTIRNAFWRKDVLIDANLNESGVIKGKRVIAAKSILFSCWVYQQKQEFCSLWPICIRNSVRCKTILLVI